MVQEKVSNVDRGEPRHAGTKAEVNVIANHRQGGVEAFEVFPERPSHHGARASHRRHFTSRGQKGVNSGVVEISTEMLRIRRNGNAFMVERTIWLSKRAANNPYVWQ
jgi:hypothetical protein